MIRRIFIYWDTGFHNAPEVVRACLVSWKLHHYDWELVILDDTNLHLYVDMDGFQHLPKSHFADIVRLRLLEKYGGVWVDATTFCVRPLDHWLPRHACNGVFLFEKPGGDRPISIWFIYSENEHYIIKEWRRVCEGYWKQNKTFQNDYFIHHHLFGQLLQNDHHFQEIWESVPKLSAIGPHILQTYGLNARLSSRSRLTILQGVQHVYKLSHKICPHPPLRKSILEFLLRRQTMLIGLENHPVFDLYPQPIVFIHIGKCAGTFIRKLFIDNFLYIREAHMVKASAIPCPAKYILWVRNPLSRFVSAFRYVKSLVGTDASLMQNLTLENSLAPGILTRKKTTGYTISPQYDELVKTFHTPSHLAESLTDPILREKALQLMSSDHEHIHKGIGWYLDNGDFIEKHHKDILFVGRMEHMEEDVQTLSRKLGFRLDVGVCKKIRENTDPTLEKDLSPLAIQNLKEFLRETDYRALGIMHSHNLLPTETIQTYFSFM